VRKIHADRRCHCAVIFRFAIERRFPLSPICWPASLQVQA
jgi:hypothetical protein